MYIDPKNLTGRKDPVESDDKSNKEEQQVEGKQDEEVIEIDDTSDKENELDVVDAMLPSSIRL